MNKGYYKYSGSSYGVPLPSEYTGVLAKNKTTASSSANKISQSGGASENCLDYIIHPINDSRVYIFSPQGDDILHKYMKILF
tara:strand:- start:728 stop:973 length:246 start_codon:yes stop_codon:yes gene_type:complete